MVVLAGRGLGGIPWVRLFTGVAPLWLAAMGIGLFNALFSGANADPSLPVAFVLGPFHVTWAALAAGVGLAARVIAIAAVGVVFAQTTDSTRLVDSLVQQGRVPERFGYGALAAYQAVPRLADQVDDPAPGAADPRPPVELAPAAAGGAAGAGDPPRGPPGAGDGRAGVRVGAAVALPRGALDVARSRGPDRGAGWCWWWRCVSADGPM